MRKRLVIAGAVTLASLGGAVLTTAPAGAISKQLQIERTIKHFISQPRPTVFNVHGASSVRCVGATPYKGKSGSKFTCYVYNKQNQGIGVLKGTNLGGHNANFHWQPSVATTTTTSTSTSTGT